MRIGVVGAGSWGTTLADLLARNGHHVHIWAREPEVVESINQHSVNQLFLPDAPLAPDLRADSDIGTVVRETELVVSATPSHAVRTLGTRIRESLNGAEPVVVSVSKGLEAGTLMVLTDVLADCLPSVPTVALSGPSFAREVYERRLTAIVAASADSGAALVTQRAFSTKYFRVYTSHDVIGVQLGGALKNVIAIAAGILDGLQLGDNARAALITRGLAETSRLGKALGAEPLTFAGLAGLGDLLLTATGGASRNRTLGLELASGRTLNEILGERRSVAEGVGTARAALELGQRAGVELPIANEIVQVLFAGKPPRVAAADLMERELKAEQWS